MTAITSCDRRKKRGVSVILRTHLFLQVGVSARRPFAVTAHAYMLSLDGSYVVLF